MMIKKKNPDGRTSGDIGGNKQNMSINISPGWRNYQIGLQRERARRRRKKFFLSAVFLAPVISLIIYGVYGAAGNLPEVFSPPEKKAGGEKLQRDPFLSGNKEEKDKIQEDRFLAGKKAVRKLLEKESLLNLEKKLFKFSAGNSGVWLNTTLDIDLQRYLLENMNTAHARQIGIVAMEPKTGKVLAMVGHDRVDTNNNPCLDNQFPAASIFKLVTAAGAIEILGLDQNSTLLYNGGKYTLYKSQLKENNNKYTRRVTLEESFADSINPVFGKLGLLKLKKPNLESYAQAFGFNRQIDFELALNPSHLEITDTPFNWAEIACGFNRETTLSPLHGALMVSAVLNQGIIPEPVFVDKIVSEKGEMLYEYNPGSLQKAVNEKTSAILYDLMEATVRSGTSRKIFRGYSRDPVLSRLDIGGKTGSIDDKSREARIDWFVGFAKEPETRKEIVISVVVAHEDYIGVRAATYAKKAFTYYFQNHFAQEEKKTG